MITQTINLNLIPGSPLPRINVSQYDNGSRTLQFNLYNGVSPYEIPSGASVYIVGTKADNTGFEYACTFDGSLVSVDITDQMTVFAGEVQSELQIRQSGEVLGTANFIINVESAALSDDTQISETDIPIIQRIPEILEEAEEYADTAHKWATFGADTETPSSTNNAKYWAEQSQVYATGALHWKGSVAFANIPTSGMIVGDFYNITDDFTTDSRFDEGAGIKCAAGTNIVWDTNNKWDILTPSTVASQVKYDGTTSGLSATNVQGAIDETFDKSFRNRDNSSGEPADMNDITTIGTHSINPDVTTLNLPVSGTWGYVEVFAHGTTGLFQLWMSLNDNGMYIRTKAGAPAVWSHWRRYEHIITPSELSQYGISTSGEQINATLEEICKKVPLFCEVKIYWTGNDTNRFGTLANQIPADYGSLYIHKNGYSNPCYIEFVQFASGNHYIRNFDYINADHLSDWINLNTVGYAIASNEPTATSSRAYSVGQYMVRGGNLKKVTKAIASGESITSNNTSNTTVGAELKQLNSDLSTKMDSVPYGNYKLKYKAIAGAFNPSETNGILHYDLDVDALGIIAMVSQTNSNFYLSTPTFMQDGWRSTINTTVNAIVSWRGIVFYYSN